MKIKWLLLLVCTSLSAGEIFQVSTFSALMEGVLEGNFRYSELFNKGDFGIGTFNQTAGGMVALEGKFYQDSPNGTLKLVRPTQKTPFATVTFFKPTKTVKLHGTKSLDHLGKFLDQFITNHNTPFAIRIDGNFRFVKLRSLRKQEPPFKPFALTVKDQFEYEIADIEGTLVGFWFPDYLAGISFRNYQFHFIDKQHERGGDVLDVSMTSGEASFMAVEVLTIDFPQTDAFNHANLMEEK